MSLVQNVAGFVFFLLAGGFLRLYLARRDEGKAPIEARFDVEVLAALAHRLVQAGTGIREAASAVAATTADPAAAGNQVVHAEDQLRLAYLIAQRVEQLQRA